MSTTTEPERPTLEQVLNDPSHPIHQQLPGLKIAEAPSTEGWRVLAVGDGWYFETPVAITRADYEGDYEVALVAPGEAPDWEAMKARLDERVAAS